MNSVFNLSVPVWSYATFSQNIWQALHHLSGPDWLTPTWSLALEEQFYLVLPITVHFLSRRGLIGACVAAIFIAPALRGMYYFGSQDVWAASYLFPCRMDGLAIGMLLALLVRQPKAMAWMKEHRRVVLSIFGVLAVLAALVAKTRDGWLVRVPGYTLVGFFCAGVLLLISYHPPRLVTRILGHAILVRIGIIAYGVYIIHQGVNDLLHWAVFHRQPLHDGFAPWLVTAASVAVTYGLASLSWKYFENPLISFSYRRFTYKRAVAKSPRAVEPVVAPSAVTANQTT